MNQPFAQRALVSGIAVGSVCSLLSVVVVLKRMAFIGEGVAHAGFGGVGTAVFLGMVATGTGVYSGLLPSALGGYSGLMQDLVIFLFCLATALAMGALSRRRRVEPDSAIGVLLVASIAWGALMTDMRQVLQTSPTYIHWFGVGGVTPSSELLLSGALLMVDTAHVWLAVILSLGVLLTAAALFKEILFFTFDETASYVSGVPTGLIYYLLLILLSITIVLAIKLAGVLLVVALLVIPGSAALQMSRRLGWVLAWAWVIGMAGVVGGLSISLEVGKLSTGPCIVAVLCVIFGTVYGCRSFRSRWKNLRRAPA